MVYALLCGLPPFETASVKSTYALISECSYNVPEYLSSEAVSFLQSTLTLQPIQRATIAALFQHSFLTGPVPESLPATALTTVPQLPSMEHSDIEESPFQFLQRVTIQLEHCLQSKNTTHIDYKASLSSFPIYVTKWVDYSNRFGFGYVFSDGGLGVLFVDGSRICTSSDRSMVQYKDRLGKIVTARTEEASSGNLEVARRLDLLTYYSRYMEENLAGPTQEEDILWKYSLTDRLPSEMVRWNRKGDGLAMLLTGRLVQVNCLSDHVKTVIWQLENVLLLTLVTPQSMKTYHLDEVWTGDLKTRIKESVLPQLRALSQSYEV